MWFSFSVPHFPLLLISPGDLVYRSVWLHLPRRLLWAFSSNWPSLALVPPWKYLLITFCQPQRCLNISPSRWLCHLSQKYGLFAWNVGLLKKMWDLNKGAFSLQLPSGTSFHLCFLRDGDFASEKKSYE